MEKKLIFVLLALFNCAIMMGQIYNKWFQYKIVTGDGSTYSTQTLIPMILEIDKKNITYYNVLNGKQSYRYATEPNLSENSINLYNFATLYKCKIDTITENRLIISALDSKTYFYKIIEHDVNTGTLKLCNDIDTLIERINVMPEFNDDFISSSLEKINYSLPPEETSKFVEISFKIKNSGKVDSILIVDPFNNEIKNELIDFIKSTDSKWRIRKKYSNYNEMTVGLKMLIMSETTKSVYMKKKLEGTASYLFRQGVRFFKDEQYNEACYFFSEAISFLEYTMYLKHYHLSRKNESYSNITYNNALINRASVYQIMNQSDLACEDWTKVLNNRPIIKSDYELAKETILNYCKNYLP